VSHTSEHRTLEQFAKQRVVVIGGGQSALESAAILHEAGAEVEVIARQPKINWLDQKRQWLKSRANPLRPLLYPPTDVGPPGLNWIVATPNLFRRLPRGAQEAIAYRSTRPAGSGWLVARLREVPIRTSRNVASAREEAGRVQLTIDDGSTRTVDHVMLATGYRVDVARYGFLAPGVLRGLRVNDGYPELGAGLESSVPGLHFVGAPAVRSFGPVCRFVSGTTFTAAELTRRIVKGGVPPRAEKAEEMEALIAA
jgi:thioredoxin reductase